MRKHLKFKSACFSELTDELRNPFRGWYSIYTFLARNLPDFDEIEGCLKADETCVLVLIDIGAYRNRELDEATLENIRQILDFFDKHKKDIILRVVYDREGKGAENEPSVFSRVIGHIDRLEPIIQQYRRRIVFFEGMLVGSWGEMHSSKFLSKSHMLSLNAALSKCACGIIRGVRKPVQWRMLNGSPPSDGADVGLYDDAIFGSDTDLGTFAHDGSESNDWEQPWPRKSELEFEKMLGGFVPQCGEAVYGEDYLSYTLEDTVLRLQYMNIACLNGSYDGRLLDIWRGMTWQKPDEWQGMNGYDYIGRHIGYRFCVKDAEAVFERNRLNIAITVENTGFSGIYQQTRVFLVLEDADGNTKEYLTDWDIRLIKSGQKQTLTWKIPCCEGGLYLVAKRDWDGEIIRFANLSDEQGRVILGNLIN